MLLFPSPHPAPDPQPGKARARRARRGVPSPFVAVDVETTGFSPADDRIIEIAWVRFVDGRAVEGRSSLVDPRRSVPPRVADITGLSAGRLAGQPRFRAVAHDVVQALADARMVVAYNAPFDRRFVSAELARAGLVLPPVPWTCALALARQRDRTVQRGSGAFSLASACARHGVLLGTAHRALDDARACGELFVRFHEEHAERSLAARLIERTRALFA